jgi:hypothetical protein
MLSLLLASAMAFADASPPSSCEVFAHAKAVMAAKPSQSGTIADWSAYQTRSWDAWKKTANDVFTRYRSGEKIPLDECLPLPEEKDALNDILPEVFYEQSIAILRQSRSPVIQAFLRAIDEKSQNHQLVLFRLLGHFKEQTPPTTGLAGVERGTESIFMNFPKIPANDWLIIFSHELLHSLDLRLEEAVEIYGDEDLEKEIVRRASTGSSAIGGAFRYSIDKWLVAGLDRGFLAEYRAWTVTFEIYLAGRRENLWQPAEWLDNVLAKSRHGESLKAFTFRYLDPNFTDVDDGPFHNSVVMGELKSVRARLRYSIPDLANLEQIYAH